MFYLFSIYLSDRTLPIIRQILNWPNRIGIAVILKFLHDFSKVGLDASDTCKFFT